MKKILVPLAEGFEEIEAVTIIDVLRRAHLKVVTASLSKEWVMGSHGIAIKADGILKDMLPADFDAVVLPGGMPGAKHLRENDFLLDILRDMNADNKWVGAICAAPTVLQAAGVIEDRKITSYPSFEEVLNERHYVQEPVVVDGNLITSRGPGTALAFSLQLVSLLEGEDLAAELTKSMLAL
ncbi:MAG: DJ-1/PfpI family protein [Bacillota bacterium]|nr:DJ-1/PfpI family protein [Bacillota bacterium]MDW7676339.1 DJ-1/PfpI family protein [Bacillota bacterium]